MNKPTCTNKCKQIALITGLTTLIGASIAFASIKNPSSFPKTPINGVTQAEISINEGIYKKGFQLCIEGKYMQFPGTNNFIIKNERDNQMYAKTNIGIPEKFESGNYLACGKVSQYIPTSAQNEKGDPYFSIDKIYSLEENPKLIHDFTSKTEHNNRNLEGSIRNMISHIMPEILKK